MRLSRGPHFRICHGPFSSAYKKVSPAFSAFTNAKEDMRFPKSQYYLTRDIKIPYFTPILWVLGMIWVVIITLLNVAAVGYDTDAFYSQSFDAPENLWYEKFLLTRSVFPASWNCTPQSSAQLNVIPWLESNLIGSILHQHGLITIYFISIY